MAQIIIDTGNVTNDGTGAPLRTAFTETNNNFTQIFTAGPVGSNIKIANNTISTTNTNGNLRLAPNGVGSIVASGPVMPDIPGVRSIGSNVNPFNTIYSQYLNANIAVLSGNLYVRGNLNVNGNVITVNYSNLTVSNTNITLASGAANASQADGSGLLVDGANTGFTYSYGANSWISNIAITAATYFGDGSNLSNVVANVNSVSLLGNVLSSTVLDSNLTTFGLVANMSAAGDISSTGNIYANVIAGNIIVGTLSGDGGNIGNLNANLIVGNVPYALNAKNAATANLAALATQAINADTALYAINANIANSANTATSAITANTAHYAIQADMANSAVVAGMAEQLSPLANLSIVGNITTGGYFIGDGGFISNITVSTTFGNSNVTSLLSSGNVTTDYVTTGNIQGDYFIGNGAYLTGISGGNANTGNITFNGTTMSGPTGSSDGYSVYIQPSADFINTLQILPTADHDIHLFEKSGNAITLGNYGESQITVNGPASANANITIQSAGNIWTFDAVGNLTVPGNLLFPGGESFGIAGANTFTFNNSGRILTDNVVTILSGGVVSANVEIATVQSNGMDLNNWIFDSSVNGNLTLPTNTSSINYANGQPYSNYGNADVAAYLPTYSGDLGNVSNVTANNVNVTSLNSNSIVYVGANGALTTDSTFTYQDIGGEMTLTVDYFNTSFVFTNDIFGSGNTINVSAAYGYPVLFDTTGGVSASGNVTADYFIGNSLSTTGDISAMGNIYIAGNANVQGNLTFNNVTNITTDNLVLGLGNNQSGVNVNGGGIVVGNTNEASFLYDYSTQNWNSNIGISTVGTITADAGIYTTNISIDTQGAGNNYYITANYTNSANTILTTGNLVTTSVPADQIKIYGTAQDTANIGYPVTFFDDSFIITGYNSGGNIDSHSLIAPAGNINIVAGLTGNLASATYNNTWTFGTDGTTSFPGNAISSHGNLAIRNPGAGVPNSTANVNSPGGWNGVGYPGSWSNLATTGGTGVGLTITVTGAGGGYATSVAIVTPGSGYTAGDVITAVGESSVSFTIGIATTSWIFDTTGNLSIPSNITGTNLGIQANNLSFVTTDGTNTSQIAIDPYLNIQLSYNGNNTTYMGNDGSVDFYLSQNQDNGNIYLQTTDVSNQYQWTFDAVGNITLPGNTSSINYANGVSILNGITGNFVFDSTDLDGTTFDEIALTGANSGNILINADGLVAVLGGYESSGMVADSGNTYIFNSDPSFVNGIPQPGVGYIWQFDNTGKLLVPQGGWIGAAGVKGDGTMLTGGTGNIASLTSFYADAPGVYSGCFTANPDGTINITTYGNGTGQLGQWVFSDANLELASTNINVGGAGSGESAKLRGTRKIVNGSTNNYAYSTVLAAGGTPTVAYTATDNSVMSVRITFAVQGANNVWEQFDVSAVIDYTGNDVNFTVSNRVKRNPAIADTVVTAALDSNDRITISLNLDASQPTGWSSFDAVEFGLMAG
jgi:cytoskeletal protein CcmA (bactofilin family)